MRNAYAHKHARMHTRAQHLSPTPSLHPPSPTNRYPLSIIVAAMSGIWTYTKLLLVGFLFWAPPKHLSVKRRGLLIRILDATGKWCLVDTQMLVIIMVALHFDITIPSDDPDAPPLLEAKVETTPMIGVDTFLAATLLSILLAFIALQLHRSVVLKDERQRDRLSQRQHARELATTALGMLGVEQHVAATSPPNSAPGSPRVTTLGPGSPSSLKPAALATAAPASGYSGYIRVYRTKFVSLGPCTKIPGLGRKTVSSSSSQQSAASAPSADGAPLPINHGNSNESLLMSSGGGGGGGARLPFWIRLLIPASLAIGLLLTAIGMLLTGFTLHVRGLVGAALGADANTQYSMASLCTSLGNVSSLAPPFVMVIFQVIFFITVVVCPLLWTLLLFAIWSLPLKPNSLRRLLVVAETVYAWAMVDCFVVIVAASLLELDQVAKFTLGDECDSINKILSTHPKLGNLLPGEASCFGVAPTLDSGYWVLTAGCVLTTLAGGYATVAGHVALSEHVARARRN